MTNFNQNPATQTEFFIVYFPCYGARGYRVFEKGGTPYNAAMGDALEGVYASRESAQKMADHLCFLREEAESVYA